MSCDAEFPCLNDPDEPCFCHGNGVCECHVFKPMCKIRYSARFVTQVREISGDHRWPLRAAGEK